MKAFVKGDTLHIELPLNAKPVPSSTGKSLLVATASQKAAFEYKGEQATLNVNAFIKAPASAK